MEQNEQVVTLNKNNSVRLWRIVFTFAILVFHFSTTFPDLNNVCNAKIGWRFAVEFFFVLSGFLLAYKCSTSKTGTWEYTKSRFFRLFPEYAVPLVAMIAFRILTADMSKGETFRFLVNSIDEFMLLHGTAISYVNINGAIWYVSALLICGHFVYYLYNRRRTLFTLFIGPASCIVIYSYMSMRIGGATGNISHFTDYGISFALLRGFAAMSLGVVSFEIYRRINNVNLTKVGNLAVWIAEISVYLLILAYTFKYGTTRVDFIFIALLPICVALSFSHKNKNYAFNNPVIRYLDKLTYSMYLTHIFVLRVICLIYPEIQFSFKLLLAYFVIVIVCSALNYHASHFVVGAFRKHKSDIRKIFIKEDTVQKSE